VLVLIVTVLLLIAIWMTVPPIPVLVLLVGVQLVVFTKILLILPQVLAVGAIFVLIPIVVVLVGAIVDTSMVFVVALAVFLAFVFLTSVVLSGGAGCDYHGYEECGGQGKKTQVSESGFHLVVLLRIRKSNPEPSGWLGGNLSRIDHIKKIVSPSASMPERLYPEFPALRPFTHLGPSGLLWWNARG
jgi:hypothetical protein